MPQQQLIDGVSVTGHRFRDQDFIAGFAGHGVLTVRPRAARSVPNASIIPPATQANHEITATADATAERQKTQSRKHENTKTRKPKSPKARKETGERMVASRC